MSVPGKREAGIGHTYTTVEPAGTCIAVVGSRDFADLGRVRRFIASLPSGFVILSGGARGVDRCANDTARNLGLPWLEYFADWDRDGLYLAGRIRNQRVAERCDRMVAFWDGKSTGTQDTFRRALELGDVSASSLAPYDRLRRDAFSSKQLVTDLSLDKLMLQDVLQKKL